MKVSLFVGDIADAPAEAICTSTNPRLSLMMGTGGSVRERGGFEVLRAAEEVLRLEFERTGRKLLPPGTAWLTTAGALPFKAVIHCIASDPTHLSSGEVVKSCVRNALKRADEAACRTLAMPAFATGHAHLKFDRSIAAIAEGLREAVTDVDEVVIVVGEREQAGKAQRMIREAMNGMEAVIR